MDGLGRRRRLTIDSGTRDAFGPPRGQDGSSGYVAGLRAHLGGAAEHDVLDKRRVEPVAAHQLGQQLGGKVDRVPTGERPAATAVGSP